LTVSVETIRLEGNDSAETHGWRSICSQAQYRLPSGLSCAAKRLRSGSCSWWGFEGSSCSIFRSRPEADSPHRTDVPNHAGFAFPASITGASHDCVLVCGLNESHYRRASSRCCFPEYSQKEDHDPASDRRCAGGGVSRRRRLFAEHVRGVQSG
jgi:hypothetical protein